MLSLEFWWTVVLRALRVHQAAVSEKLGPGVADAAKIST